MQVASWMGDKVAWLQLYYSALPGSGLVNAPLDLLGLSGDEQHLLAQHDGYLGDYALSPGLHNPLHILQ